MSRKKNTLESFYNEVNVLVSKANNPARALDIFEKVSYKRRFQNRLQRMHKQ